MFQHSDLGSHGLLNTFKTKTPGRPACQSGLPPSAFQDDIEEEFINLELRQAEG
jgi:hypothetical protein